MPRCLHIVILCGLLAPLVALAIPTGASVVHAQQTSTDPTPIAVPFRAFYWQTQGYRTLGRIVSEPVEMNGMTMQYFEKGRLEDHRATAPTPDWAFGFGRLVADMMERAPEQVISGTPLRYGDLLGYTEPTPAPPGFGGGVAVGGDNVFIPSDAALSPAPGYLVPRRFWDYLNRADLFPGGWLHDAGLPMTSAFAVDVDGRPVQFQAFERTLLTYDASKPTEWQVERANVGTDAMLAMEQEPLNVEATPPRYFFPVQNADCGYGPDHHTYPATDIFCPTGSTLVATTSGIIDWITRTDNWDPATNLPDDRGGLSLAIIGDDGLRYYGSHMESIAPELEVGTRVTAGQYIGTLGITGNARFTPPHLHYGISYPTTPDDTLVRRGVIPPYTYLRAWERGENITPGTGMSPLPVPPIVTTGSAEAENPAYIDPEQLPLFPTATLDGLFDRAGGTYGTIIYDIPTASVVYSRNADTVFSAASTIKVPIAVTIYRLAAQGALDLNALLTLQASDVVGGTGVLQGQPVGSQYPVRELVRLMLAESDNTATNMLLRYIGGFAPVNTLLAEIGAGGSVVQREMMDFASLQAGRDNLTTPTDMLRVLLLLTADGVLDGSARVELLSALQQTSDRQKIPALLPAGAVVQHKIGTLGGVEHDVGLVQTHNGRRYAAVFFSSDLPSNAAGIATIAEASRIVYEYEQTLALP